MSYSNYHEQNMIAKSKYSTFSPDNIKENDVSKYTDYTPILMTNPRPQLSIPDLQDPKSAYSHIHNPITISDNLSQQPPYYQLGPKPGICQQPWYPFNAGYKGYLPKQNLSPKYYPWWVPEGGVTTPTLPVTLLVRSYNRPHYLAKTLNSLYKSNINLCAHRYIYDDGSTDKATLEILNNLSKQLGSKQFQVKLNENNVGCKQSYLDALYFLKKSPFFDPDGYSCIIDNDVEVKPNFIENLYTIYNEGYRELKYNNIVLSGFNPDNAHFNAVLKQYKNFHTKKTVGGICYFFSNHLIDLIEKAWLSDMDLGVNHTFNSTSNHFMCCVNKSLVQHIGDVGINSNNKRYDYDSKF